MARRAKSTGAAGAYLVASRLARLDFPVAVTIDGTVRTDVLAQVGAAQLPAAIQVKTKSEGSKDFRLLKLERAAEDANEWVVLVSLVWDGEADYFVVPRDHAWATVQATLPDNYLGLIGPDAFENYRNRWELFEQPSWEADWLVADWVFSSWEALPWPQGTEPVPR